MLRSASPAPARRVGRQAPAPSRIAGLLPFVLTAFAANSLITRHVVAGHLMDAGLLSAVRFISGASSLLVLSAVRRGRVVIARTNLRPAWWLGVYGLTISFGYRHIGAAPGTFVFYASVLVTLMVHERITGSAVPLRRVLGAGVSLGGLVVLALGSVSTVTVTGVALLAVTGLAWGRYTAAGRTDADPTVATTGHFTVLAGVLLVPTAVGALAGLHVSAVGLAWAVGMGAGTTALAYVAWYACQRSISATTAGSVQLAIPVLTTAGAVLFLGETLSMALFVAAALVGAGMWLGRQDGAGRRPGPPLTHRVRHGGGPTGVAPRAEVPLLLR